MSAGTPYGLIPGAYDFFVLPTLDLAKLNATGCLSLRLNRSESRGLAINSCMHTPHLTPFLPKRGE